MSGATPRSRELSLLDLLLVTWRRKLLIAVILAVGIGGSSAFASLFPRTYVARTLLLIEPAAGEGAGLGAAIDSAAIDSQVQVLSSRSLAREVVSSLGLEEDPELLGAAPGFVAGLLAPLRAAWTLLAPPRPGGGGSDPAVRHIDGFLERLEVSREGKTYVIAVAFASADPDKAALVANAVAERWIVGQLAVKYEAARHSAERIGERLAGLKARLEEAQLELARRRGAASDPGAPGSGETQSQIAQLGRELVAATVERTAGEARLARLRQLLRKGELGIAFEEGGASTLLQNLQMLEAQLLRREAELAAQYGERHPRILDLRREKNELQARIAGEQRRLVDEFAGTVGLARIKERTIAAELERLRRQAREREQAGEQVGMLEEQLALDRRLYESYLARLDAGSVGEGAQRPDARVISEAVPPTSPAFPKPRLVLTVSLLVSLVVALVAVYLAELADRGFRTETDVGEALGLRNLALVPRLPGARSATALAGLVAEKPRGRAAESLRSMLAGLLAERPQTGGKVLLVTSCLPGEGKTSLALALGRVAAAEGLRTLLIDADLRRPRVHEILGERMRAGLAEFLRGEADLAGVLRTDPGSGLTLLPGSRRMEQSTRLLGEQGIGRLLAAARQAYDLVLVDSAPLLAVADARQLAPHADQVLLVVRWQKTPRSLVRDCLPGQGELAGRICGTVLSQVDLRRHARYGYGDTASAQLRLAPYYVE
ncbi:AAA family ATPase [Geminicoccaceae bacterium 1502E]|nr:AAA family ATPase [Geminicoccaceae bacterium 1502E]